MLMYGGGKEEFVFSNTILLLIYFWHGFISITIIFLKISTVLKWGVKKQVHWSLSTLEKKTSIKLCHICLNNRFSIIYEMIHKLPLKSYHKSFP